LRAAAAAAAADWPVEMTRAISRLLMPAARSSLCTTEQKEHFRR